MSLEAQFHSLNQQHFAGSLPLPRLAWNSRLRSSAGRFCPGSRNLLKPRISLIEIASYLRERTDGEEHIRDTMLHEMVHYFLWHQRRPHGHTAEFKVILRRVGARRYNPVPKESAVKYWYECPSCRARSPARRRLGDVACLACCKKYHRGKYSEKFRLRQVSDGVVIPVAAPVVTAIAGLATKPLPFAEVLRRLEELRSIVLRKN